MQTNTNPRDNMPAAWYDLSCRIGNARAVVDIALDYCFVTVTPSKEQCEHNARIVSALQDLIALCEQDVATLEQQLLGVDR